MTKILTHLAVTPARNEAENIPRLAASLAAQRWRPTMWVIVDNGSTDGTPELVEELARTKTWIRLLSIGSHKDPTRGSASVRAFNVGTSLDDADLVTNIDADVSFEEDYFERLRAEFERHPTLGIASGTCYERNGAVWKPVHVTRPNLRGAALTFRRACLEELAPLEGRMGWDGIATIRASVRGWETAMVPDLPYLHHRATGQRDGNRFDTWAVEGDSTYYMWYRPSYLVLRVLYRVAREHDFAVLGLMWGFARSAMRRAPRQPEPGFRAFVRTQQSIHRLPERRREVAGRTAPSGPR